MAVNEQTYIAEITLNGTKMQLYQQASSKADAKKLAWEQLQRDCERKWGAGGLLVKSVGRSYFYGFPTTFESCGE